MGTASARRAAARTGVRLLGINGSSKEEFGVVGGEGKCRSLDCARDDSAVPSVRCPAAPLPRCPVQGTCCDLPYSQYLCRGIGAAFADVRLAEPSAIIAPRSCAVGRLVWARP